MPELPEVEAVCRKLRRQAVDSTIARAVITRPSLTKPAPPEAIVEAIGGRRIVSIGRRAKNIFLHLDDGHAIHVHLRMTGNLYVVPDHRFRNAYARAWCEFTDGRGLVFEDSRALGTMRLLDAAALDALDRSHGPEPLDRRFTAAAFAAIAESSRQPAKLFLLDQTKIAGLGNIYAAEALFAAGIDPRAPIGRVRRSKLDALHAAIVDILRRAVKSAMKAYNQPGRLGEAEEFPLLVYDREGQPCVTCERSIRRMTQGGRSTYFCPACQRAR
jgi:formamidopyrimidine-DNA glycosylase